MKFLVDAQLPRRMAGWFVPPDEHDAGPVKLIIAVWLLAKEAGGIWELKRLVNMSVKWHVLIARHLWFGSSS